MDQLEALRSKEQALQSSEKLRDGQLVPQGLTQELQW